jgi:glycerol-3-phosphate acyltransferase PlsY
LPSFGYLAGSIPFGLLLTKAAGLGDVRSIGSGNIGATNVLRTGNKTIAALTLLCDGLKGFFPALAASLLGWRVSRPSGRGISRHSPGTSFRSG